MKQAASTVNAAAKAGFLSLEMFMGRSWAGGSTRGKHAGLSGKWQPGDRIVKNMDQLGIGNTISRSRERWNRAPVKVVRQ